MFVLRSFHLLAHVQRLYVTEFMVDLFSSFLFMPFATVIYLFLFTMIVHRAGRKTLMFFVLFCFFHFSISCRWCHQSTWPVAGCSSSFSYLWSFASHLLGLCDRSLGQNAQPRVLLPTSWSLLATGALRLSQSSIHCSDPLHSGPNS